MQEGIFSRFVKSGKSTGKSGKDNQDFSYIYEIAGLISDNDTEIKSLLSENGSTKVSDTDALWLDMTEKLEEYGYAFSIDLIIRLNWKTFYGRWNSLNHTV